MESVAGWLTGWQAGYMTGGQTCCWKNIRAAEASHRQISKRWNWKQPSPLWNLSLEKLTSSAYCDLFDTVQAACRTCFLYQGQCSCIDIALMVKLWCFGVWELIFESHFVKIELAFGSLGCIKEAIPLVSNTTTTTTEFEQQLMSSPELTEILQRYKPLAKYRRQVG